VIEMNKYQHIDDLPEVIEPLDLKDFLKISKTAAYELVKSKQFHVVKIGRTFKVPKKAFQQWFEGQHTEYQANT
jgi:excisionase family DNA binding protein